MNNTLLAYALNAENKLVHIDSVKNGLECGCICPGCKEKLVAKNDGKVREHHFAHVSGNDCGTGYQTIRHIWGKEILFENRTMPIAINGKKGFIKAEAIGMEVKLTDLNIVPDVFAKVVQPCNYLGIQLPVEIPLIAEILVTHKVDDEKVEIIRKAGVPAVEIDLSKSMATTKEELIKDISNQDNWNIINDKVGARFMAGVQSYVNGLINAYRSSCGYSGYTTYSRPRRTYHKNYRKHR